jgi:hypothetical protein
MALPFELEVARVYSVAFDVPVMRRRGAKVFSR